MPRDDFYANYLDPPAVTGERCNLNAMRARSMHGTRAPSFAAAMIKGVNRKIPGGTRLSVNRTAPVNYERLDDKQVYGGWMRI